MSDSPPDTVDLRETRVPDSAAGRRFDAVLAELFPEFSRSRLAAWIREGDALLDGRAVRPRDPVRGGELVRLAARLEVETVAVAQDIPLRVRSEERRVGKECETRWWPE